MKRHATATWKGGPRAGEGTISTASGVFDKAIYTGGTTSMDIPCTNPAEILAAAEAACVSMMVAKELGKEGITAEHIETRSEIVLAPDGSIIYREEGQISLLKLRRAILAALPDAGPFAGNAAYWSRR